MTISKKFVSRSRKAEIIIRIAGACTLVAMVLIFLNHHGEKSAPSKNEAASIQSKPSVYNAESAKPYGFEIKKPNPLRVESVTDNSKLMELPGSEVEDPMVEVPEGTQLVKVGTLPEEGDN